MTGMMDELHEQDMERKANLERVAKALLLFHHVGVWTDEETSQWNGLLQPVLRTDNPIEVTTKKLCDAARAALGCR